MDIIERIQNGDKEAIKEVYKDNSKEVYEFAKSITGDHESALEATKQTFIRLFSLIQKGQHPTNIRSTALKLAHDEACKIAMPSSDIVVSPYDEPDEELTELDKAVGDHENDGAMGETRVISLPREAIDELADDDSDYSSIEEVGRTEVRERPSVQMSSDYADKAYNNKRSKRSYYEDDNDYDYEEDEDYDDYDDYDEPKKHGAGFVICVIINIILILILLWFVVGLLEHLNIISQINLGYEWFNAHIANIF